MHCLARKRRHFQPLSSFGAPGSARTSMLLGGDRHAAELMGVPAGATTAGIYAFSGFMAAAAGILYSLYTQSGYPLPAVGLELDAIAATIIGGTLLAGGYGSV